MFASPLIDKMANFEKVMKKFLFCLFVSMTIFKSSICIAQSDLESVPSTWVAAKGTLAADTNHYRLGTKSVVWRWSQNDTLKVTDIQFSPSLLTDYSYNTLDVCMYNTSFSPSDSVIIQLFDKYNRLRYYFPVHLNYKGWFEIIRSYRYDMYKPKNAPTSTDSITTAYIITPKNSSGQLNFDNVNWINARKTTPISLMMPDSIVKIANNYPPYDFNTIYLLPPNIPKTIPTTSELTDLQTVRTSYLSDMTTKPSTSAKNTANAFYTANGYAINTDGSVKGKPMFAYPQDAGGRFANFTLTLQTFTYSWYTNKKDTVSLNKAITMLRYLLDNGNFAGGTYKIGPYDALEFYTSLAVLNNTIYAKDTVLFNDLSNYVKWQNNFGAAWMPSSIGSPLYTDNLREEITGYLAYPLFMLRDTAAAIQNLKGFKQLLANFMKPDDGAEDNIKVDGASFHHNANYYNYVEPCYSSLARWLYHLRNTQFKPSFTTYKLIRDEVYNFFLEENTFSTTYGNKGESQQSSFKTNPNYLLRLAMLGKGITSNNYDYRVGCAYNRLYPNSPTTSLPVATYPAEHFPSGFYQLNYATMGVYRKNNWLATVKMLSPDFWGSQLGLVGDNGQRRDVYSRYLGYGSMDIQYSNGLDSSGYTFDNYKYTNGYDHNFPNGATTIVMDYDSLACNENYGDEYANAGSLAASLSFNNRDTSFSFKTRGDFGLSAMNFQQAPYGFNGGCRGSRRNTTYTFQKSWFAFDSIIVCLGTGISNNDNLYSTATNIFQLTDSGKVIYINNVANNTFPFTAQYKSNSPYQLISPYGTGFYIKSTNDSLHISVGKQQYFLNPGGVPDTSTGNWAKVWLDHGKNPLNKSYEYVVLPSSTPSSLSHFADSMNQPSTACYIVKQANTQMHYVYYRSKGIHGYAIFSPLTDISDTTSLLMSTDSPCWFMASKTNDTLQLTVVNPNPNLLVTTTRSNRSGAFISMSAPSTIQISLRGKWNIVTADSSISIASKTDSSTILNIVTQYSLPNDAILKIDTGTLLNIKQVDTFHLPARAAEIESIKVFPDPVVGKSVITVQYSSPEGKNYLLAEIFDIKGKRVFGKAFNANRGENNIRVLSNNFSKGTYIVRVSGNGKQPVVSRFVVN